MDEKSRSAKSGREEKSENLSDERKVRGSRKSSSS